MARKKGSKDYPVEIKLEAIRLFYEGGMTQAEITKKLNIRDPNRVKNWLWLQRKEGVMGLKKPRRGRPRKEEKKETVEKEIVRLRMENDLLKNIHSELQKDFLAKRNIGQSTNTEENTK